MAEWYWMKDGQKRGPMGAAQLKQLANTGQLQPTDIIWREGLPNGVPASRVEDLFPRASGTTPSEDRMISPPRPARDSSEPSKQPNPIRRKPKATLVVSGGCAALVAIASIVTWWTIRDTWEEDNRVVLQEMSDSVVALIQRGEAEEGLAKYAQFRSRIGNRVLTDSHLCLAASVADRAAENARLRLRREKDGLARVDRLESEAMAFMTSGDYRKGVGTYREALDLIRDVCGGGPQAVQARLRVSSVMREAERRLADRERIEAQQLEDVRKERERTAAAARRTSELEAMATSEPNDSARVQRRYAACVELFGRENSIDPESAESYAKALHSLARRVSPSSVGRSGTVGKEVRRRLLEAQVRSSRLKHNHFDVLVYPGERRLGKIGATYDGFCGFYHCYHEHNPYGSARLCTLGNVNLGEISIDQEKKKAIESVMAGRMESTGTASVGFWLTCVEDQRDVGRTILTLSFDKSTSDAREVFKHLARREPVRVWFYLDGADVSHHEKWLNDAPASNLSGSVFKVQCLSPTDPIAKRYVSQMSSIRAKREAEARASRIARANRERDEKIPSSATVAVCPRCGGTGMKSREEIQSAMAGGIGMGGGGRKIDMKCPQCGGTGTVQVQR